MAATILVCALRIIVDAVGAGLAARFPAANVVRAATRAEAEPAIAECEVLVTFGSLMSVELFQRRGVLRRPPASDAVRVRALAACSRIARIASSALQLALSRTPP